MIIGPDDGKSPDYEQTVKLLEQMTETLTFLQAEWSAANEYLASLGFPSHEEDEYGDVEFVKLEERIRRAIDER